jgi:predicted DNA binding CopG/RHH family protein
MNNTTHSKTSKDNIGNSRLSKLQGELEFLQQTLGKIKKNKLKKRVTLRMYEDDIELVKRRASSIGLPYQTYISMLVHQEITGRKEII